MQKTMVGIRSFATDGCWRTPLSAKYSGRVVIRGGCAANLGEEHTKITNEEARIVTESQRETP